MPLRNTNMEAMAENLRKEVLQLKEDQALDPFDIEITGVDVYHVNNLSGLSDKSRKQLTQLGSGSWSAMSVPIGDGDSWAILINEKNSIQRQRVSLLEELWHIIQGHQLTAISKVGDYYGRAFETESEHDAYYLAAATLVPKEGLRKQVKANNVDVVAEHYGVSKDLIEYRIKRLGLWTEYKGKTISLKRGGGSH